MKKFLFLIIAVYAVFTFTTCETLMAAFQEPNVSLQSVDLTNITFNSANLLCKVAVQNVNSFELPFPQTDWRVFINSNSFLNGTLSSGSRVRARNTSVIEVPVSLDYLQVLNAFKSLKGSKDVGYKVALAVSFNFPVIGEKVFNFDYEGALPLPQLPRFSKPAITLDKRDATRAELLVSIDIENPNVFELPSPKINYDYSLNRNSFIKGVVESEAPLAPSAVTPLNFRLVVTYADLLRSFASLVTAREVSSLLNISCDFGIPIFSGETLKLELPGTLPLR
ncbi:MAG: LEA type 2 family protein [Treponema sp.]|nr:LEA type 2 family protein [Treponema sp.]